MARIFVSHSSSDNHLARALCDWLVAEGWEDDFFLDFDPERGIVPGERWEKALLDAAERCEAVLFLVTRNWLGSGWCLREFHLAAKLNKRMFMILADGLAVADLPPELTAEWQLVDLFPRDDSTAFPVPGKDGGTPAEVRFSTNGLRRLLNGLKKAGLDPAFFAWPPPGDPLRAPYRGLRALDKEDAGIFFGRDAQIITALDRLRGLREAAPPRFLVLLGASGAGKSSFMRAGLLPRLERDDRRFLPLPVIRPEQRVISGETGFIRALEAGFAAIGQPLSRAEIARRIDGPRTGVAELFARLAQGAAHAPEAAEIGGRGACIVLAIDQGEELFLAEGKTEATIFLQILRALLLTPDLPLLVLICIRSDSYDRLQSAEQLASVRQETLSLPPMPRSSYETIINGPATRLVRSGRRFEIEPALTQALLADIEEGGGKDALPLLGFTIALLYARCGQSGRLTLKDYEALGRIRGSIEVAVEAALAQADRDPRIPRDRDARLDLLRRAFIPWLAGVDLATNSIRRRVARMAEVPPEARPLIELLIEARLLSRDVDADGETTVEPAHEALLRQWGTLKGWLDEAFAALATLEGVKRAARDWEANARAPSWLAHKAGRLEDAEHSRVLDDRKALRRSGESELKAFLSKGEIEYLEACRTAENAERDRELENARQLAASKAKTARRTLYGLVAALVLLAAASVLGALFWWQRNEAQARTLQAQASLAVVRANAAKAEGAIPQAAALALDGYRKLANVETRSALLDAALSIDPHLEFALPSVGEIAVTAMVWLGPDDLLLATKEGRRTGLERLRFGPGGPVAVAAGWQVPRVMFDQEDEATILALAAGADGSVIAARNTGAVEVYRRDGPVTQWHPPEREWASAYALAAIGADGQRVVFGGPEEARLVSCTPPGSGTLFCEPGETLPGAATAVALDAAGQRGIVAFADGTLQLDDGLTSAKRLAPEEVGQSIRALAVSGGQIAAIVQSSEAAQGAGGSLALIVPHGERFAVQAHGPVNVGTAPVLLWRTASDVVHGCLSTTLTSGPLCTTHLEAVAGTAGWTDFSRLTGHRSIVDQVALAPEGIRLAARDVEDLKVWRWPADRLVHAILAQPPAGGWADMDPRSDGTTLLLSGHDGGALDLSFRRDPHSQTALPTVAGRITAAVVVPGGRVIAQETQLVFVPDGTSAPAAALPLPSPVLPQGGLVWTGRGRAVAVSLEGQRVGLVDFDAPQPELLDIEPPAGRFQPFGITVDRGRGRLIVSSTDGTVHLFDLATRRPLGTLANTHVADVSQLLGAEGLAVSADGRYLATTAAGNSVMLYDLERGTSVALLRTNREETKSVAFDSAGTRLTVIDAAGMISVWALAGAAPQLWLNVRLEPSRPDLPVTPPAVRFLRDGGLVVLTPSSEVLYLSLDETAWVKRLETLGYDKLPPAP